MTFFKQLTKLSTILSLFALVVPMVLVQARQVVVVDRTSNPIPASSTATFNIYFLYNGALQSDIDIRNAVANVKINGSALQFVPGSFEDFFNGSPTRGDNEAPPATVSCNASYTGPKYAIGASLASTTNLTYGLQSAYNGTGGSNTATLRSKASGCIKVPLKLSPTAKDGDIVSVVFDEDSATSPDYPANLQPPIVSVKFKIGPASSSSSSSVSSVVSSSVGSSSSVAVSSSSQASSATQSSSISVSSSSRTSSAISSSSTTSSLSSSRISSSSLSSSRSSSSLCPTCVASSSSTTSALVISSSSSSNPKEELDRSGGATMLGFVTAGCALIIGLIAYRIRKKVKKIDITNDK